VRLTFDPKYNIAYIALREKSDQVETIHLSEDLKVDIGADGTVYGIELLNASEQLGQSLILRDANGNESEVQLPSATSPPAA
jgi:uncharacterized protein YuzE